VCGTAGSVSAGDGLAAWQAVARFTTASAEHSNQRIEDFILAIITFGVVETNSNRFGWKGGM
jgi:hypothetical protein